MTTDWFPRSGYEVAWIDRQYVVLVRGGTHSTGEPALTVVARCSERDEAYRVRDALRTTLPAAAPGGEG